MKTPILSFEISSPSVASPLDGVACNTTDPSVISLDILQEITYDDDPLYVDYFNYEWYVRKTSYFNHGTSSKMLQLKWKDK